MSAREDAPIDESTRAPVGALSAYASGSFGMGVWVTVPGLLLLYFLTDILGVAAALAGLTLLLPKIIDVVIHPMIGSRSDRQARALGHRRRMMTGGVALGLAMVAMFTVPSSLEGAPAAAWVGGWYIVGNLLFAMFQVPYLTTPSDLRIGYHERTRVFMFRMLFLTVGLLGAGVAAPALVSSEQRGDYTTMAAVLAVVMVVSALVAILGVRRLTDACGFRAPAESAGHSTIADVKVAWADRDFRMLVLSYLFTGTTTHLFMAALPYFTRYVFDSAGLTAVFMGCFLAPAVLAGPIWLRLSRRIGKQRGLLLSQLIFVVGSLAVALGAWLDAVAVSVVVVAVMGFAFAGLQLFAFSMVPDAVAAAEEKGDSQAGAYTGVWTATEALGTAAGPYLYSAALAVGGFVSSTADVEVTQPDSAMKALLWGFTVLPAALMVVAIVFQRRYRLDPARR
ncbi:MFS transporter [Aeromicrobium senzhongii]|uniref:MFS transporter n=1 Tax=Aeromicrobium senzhongii TaxID=2663859 RepID=A0ABX6SUY5_9ACTN|nr:MFS transporter [Aeromicrobium senzhongii]MTB88623.1 MFS transporter [Aeromicrobium senzhongii]QNL94070.1 MFS transporter [Aeromicrobium senzhongii]